MSDEKECYGEERSMEERCRALGWGWFAIINGGRYLERSNHSGGVSKCKHPAGGTYLTCLQKRQERNRWGWGNKHIIDMSKRRKYR